NLCCIDLFGFRTSYTIILYLALEHASFHRKQNIEEAVVIIPVPKSMKDGIFDKGLDNYRGDLFVHLNTRLYHDPVSKRMFKTDQLEYNILFQQFDLRS